MNPILCILTLSFLLPGTAALAATASAAATGSPDTVKIDAAAADNSTFGSSMRGRTEPSPQQQSMVDLARLLAPDTEANWLETNSDRTLSLFYPATEPVPLGAVILLPDEHSHPDWPEDMHPLRTGLSDHGWDTLSIAMPQTRPMPIPERTELQLQASSSGAQASPDATTDTAAEPEAASAVAQIPVTEPVADTAIPAMELYGERVLKICEAAIRHLESRERDYLILLGSGSGATWAALCASQFQQTHQLALIMLNPRLPDTQDAPHLPELLTRLNIPTLDLIQENASAAEIEAARLRANSAKRAGLADYHQSRLPILPLDGGAWLLREVRGRISRYLQQPAAEIIPPAAAERPPGQ